MILASSLVLPPRKAYLAFERGTGGVRIRSPSREGKLELTEEHGWFQP
jgi:hypothetical protein